MHKPITVERPLELFRLYYIPPDYYKGVYTYEGEVYDFTVRKDKHSLYVPFITAFSTYLIQLPSVHGFYSSIKKGDKPSTNIGGIIRGLGMFARSNTFIDASTNLRSCWWFPKIPEPMVY